MIANKLEYYLDLLQRPPATAKGYTRWWWYASAVTREEIDRELGLILDAGLGGVELQILYAMEADDPSLGIEHETYFSPRFFELLDYTLTKAHDLGLWVDLTLGSGWPFGGPFVPFEMAPEVLLPYQVDIIGPKRYEYDFTTVLPGHPIKAVIGKFENGVLVAASLQDVSDCIVDTWLYNWQWGYKIDPIDIPEGHWKLYLFVVNPYKQQVGKPAPGMEGYAIDHCRADAAELYFHNYGDPLVDMLGEGRVRSFFCDSIELGGNNWTPILLEEFRKRRGYDLSPYMPALWGEVGDITEDVRYDYSLTFGELTVENFFRPFAEWCRSRGSKSRIQAHGTWGDILQAYAAADYPEGETFGEHDKYEVNTIHRRLASSAGHLYGRNVISNETFTWLRKPRFLETLEMMKAAVDAVFLDGMNHIVNHGYSYSPESAGKPGWVFYASSFISHNNTWWEYYPYLAQYIHRVSAFLQLGEHYAETAVYLPQADIRSSMPISELHMALKLEEHIGRDFINRVQKAGFYFDYMNDEALESIAEVGEGGLAVGGNRYKALILPRVKRIPVSVAERLETFVQAGGILLALGEPPQSSCGLMDRDNKKSRVRETIGRLFGVEEGTWRTCGAGKALYTMNEEALVGLLDEALEPDLRIEAAEPQEGGTMQDGTSAVTAADRIIPVDSPSQTIGYIHRKHKGDNVYFISNISTVEHSVHLTFKHAAGSLVILDPMTGERVWPEKVERSGNRAELSLRFEPYQSLLFVFGINVADGAYGAAQDVECQRFRERIAGRQDISADWMLSIEEKGLRRHLPVLQTWEQFPETRYHSGAGEYRKTVVLEIPDNTTHVYLELEQVREVAEVFVDGVSAGILWKAPRRLDITEFVNQGVNELRIKTANLWINHMINPSTPQLTTESGLMSNWPYFKRASSAFSTSVLYGSKERDVIREPLPSGLAGRATLIYVRKESASIEL